jgi:hypothetical protein
MRICLFVLHFMTIMEKIINLWKPKEDTFFLYDLDTQEIEPLYV